ncbi:GH25 family lysozyme, partial [Streptomyces albidoflavus]|uniref:GH25 family lysozyme n=1 Tax=Streptomyces albidoflavus TaxID=1886 RepID=UPI0035273F4D
MPCPAHTRSTPRTTSSGPAAAAPAPVAHPPGRDGGPGCADVVVGPGVGQGLGAAPDERTIGPADTSGVQGIDVSHWQGSINWSSVKSAGMSFAYIK